MPNEKLTTIAAGPTGEDGAIQVTVTLPVRQRRQQRRKGGQPDSESRARIPRITRLMALAIKFQDMVDRGEVRDYADLARLGYVTRARITQIMNLLNLAPRIQEDILVKGRLSGRAGAATERQIRSVAKFVLWEDQTRAWGDREDGLHPTRFVR
jgi:hypothetical protein